MGTHEMGSRQSPGRNGAERPTGSQDSLQLDRVRDTTFETEMHRSQETTRKKNVRFYPTLPPVFQRNRNTPAKAKHHFPSDGRSNEEHSTTRLNPSDTAWDSDVHFGWEPDKINPPNTSYWRADPNSVQKPSPSGHSTQITTHSFRYIPTLPSAVFHGEARGTHGYTGDVETTKRRVQPGRTSHHNFHPSETPVRTKPLTGDSRNRTLEADEMLSALGGGSKTEQELETTPEGVGTLTDVRMSEKEHEHYGDRSSTALYVTAASTLSTRFATRRFGITTPRTIFRVREEISGSIKGNGTLVGPTDAEVASYPSTLSPQFGFVEVESDQNSTSGRDKQPERDTERLAENIIPESDKTGDRGHVKHSHSGSRVSTKNGQDHNPLEVAQKPEWNPHNFKDEKRGGKALNIDKVQQSLDDVVDESSDSATNMPRKRISARPTITQTRPTSEHDTGAHPHATQLPNTTQIHPTTPPAEDEFRITTYRPVFAEYMRQFTSTAPPTVTRGEETMAPPVVGRGKVAEAQSTSRASTFGTQRHKMIGGKHTLLSTDRDVSTSSGGGHSTQAGVKSSTAQPSTGTARGHVWPSNFTVGVVHGSTRSVISPHHRITVNSPASTLTPPRRSMVISKGTNSRSKTSYTTNTNVFAKRRLRLPTKRPRSLWSLIQERLFGGSPSKGRSTSPNTQNPVQPCRHPRRMNPRRIVAPLSSLFGRRIGRLRNKHHPAVASQPDRRLSDEQRRTILRRRGRLSSLGRESATSGESGCPADNEMGRRLEEDS